MAVATALFGATAGSRKNSDACAGAGRKPKPRSEDLVRRLSALTAGLTVTKVLKADDHELVIEFADGTRLLVKADERLDISVT